MLRRWTAHHQQWKKAVESIGVDSPDGVLLFDPLDQPEEGDHTFITTFFHARTGRGRVWAPQKLVRRLASRGVEVTDPFELGDALPGGVQAFDTARDGEVAYWVPGERLLVVGDVLLGGPLRLCPKSWMGKASLDDLRAALLPLLDLPIELIQLGHGEPVLEDGRNALAALL
jgi:glyoxylase-like metal-dependent hydrolase (beta-lactamase superfamily II)